MLLLLALAVAAGPTTTRVLVLDLKPSGGVEPNVVENITGLCAAILSEDARLEVLSGPDLRQMMDLQGQKSAVGCTGDASCIAEVAGALDAKLVLFGNIGYLGTTINLNLTLFDQAAGKNVGRRAVQAKTLEDLAAQMRPALGGLVGGLLGAATAAPGSLGDTPRPPGSLGDTPRPPGPPLPLGTIALVGGGIGVALGAVLLGTAFVPTMLVQGEETKFKAGDASALERAAAVQAGWFDNGLALGIALGGGALVAAGGGALAFGIVGGGE